MAWDDQLVSRITDRLAGDAELRREVARELRAHLEDSAREFRQAGLGEQEAADQAAKALGDPRELSEELWRANRGRMRFRAVVRWAASLALLPAAIAVIVGLALSFHGLNVTSAVFSEDGLPKGVGRNLTEEQLYVLRGDPKATTAELRAKSIADRWPDNPVYFGNYFAFAQLGFHEDGKPRPDRLDDLLALADQGERVDPDNAFYNVLKAALMCEVSSTVEDDTSLTHEVMDRTGKVTTRPFRKITVTDPAMFNRGLEEFRRGLAKPLFTDRTLEMMDLRLAMLGTPRQLADIVATTAMEVSVLLPSLGELRGLAKAVTAYAIDQAARGDQSAVELACSVELMADRMGASSKALIELLVAQATRQTALAGLEQVGKKLGDDALAEDAFARRREQEEFTRDLLRKRRAIDSWQLPHAGMLWSVLMPSLPGYAVNFEPLRTMESLTVLHVALLELLATLVVLAGIFGLAALWGMLRRADRPILLFVGWRRIGRIVLLSIVLPLALYGPYAAWQVFEPRAYGLNYSLDRVLVELAMLLCAVTALLLGMSYRAIRQRCLEIGVEAPPPITPRKRRLTLSAAGLVALACAIFIIYWWAGPSPSIGPFALFGVELPVQYTPGLVLAGVVLAMGALWVLRELIALLRSRLPEFRRTFFRSAMPILCSAIIVVGLAVGALLSLGETSAGRRATGLGAMSFSAEIDRSDYRLLRERFAAWGQEAQDRAASQPAE